jgi:general secretion pathway protein D
VLGVGHFGFGRLRPRGVLTATLIISSIVLAACNSATLSGGDHGDANVLDKSAPWIFHPAIQNKQVPTSPWPREMRRPRSTPAARAPRDAGAAPSRSLLAFGNGFQVNFENTPVATVAKVVLGDIIGVGYTIDPRVQGTVNLASVRAIPESDILYVLENALRLSGTALARDTAGYRLVPLGDAVGTSNVDPAGSAPEPGYGLSVVPLQFVSAQTRPKLLDSFALRPGTVRADRGRNVLLIQGTPWR